VVVTGTLRRGDGGAARLLDSLAQVHAGGVAVDWRAVLGGGRRVELPTYAFQRQRFWPRPAARPVPGGDGAGSAAEARFWAAVEGGDAAGLARTLAVREEQGLVALLPALASWRHRERERGATEGWRYQIAWAPVAEIEPRPAALAGTWLVVTPAGAGCEALARTCGAALTARGAHVVIIEADAAEADRAALANHLSHAWPAQAAAAGNGAVIPAVTGVLSLLALHEAPLPRFPVVPGGLAATQALMQAMGDAPVKAPLWVVTRGAVAAGEQETVASPAQAQAWGMGRVAALEHPDWWGGLIDLPPVLDEQAADRLCAVLAGSDDGGHGEDQVAIRAAGIMARRLDRAPSRRGETAWTPRGTALITGGTGMIGGHVARWLAERNAPRLVLASRSGPAAAGVAETAAELAAAGTEVTVVACDSASRAPLAGLVNWIGHSGPPLTAVVHAAGAVQTTPLEETTLTELATVLAAKAGGAAHLDELTEDLDLDAFVVFSSAAATWGSVTQPGYAAANAFLDGLASVRRARGLAATSVAWGLWGGGGMGDGESGHLLERHGVLAMDPRLAVKSLAQALDSGESLLTVADVDWTRFAPSFTLRRPSPLIEALPEVRQALADADLAADSAAAADGGTLLAKRLAGLLQAEQELELVSVIRAEAAAVLGYSSPGAIEADRAFRDLGFDSLTALELRNRLTTATGRRLPATLVFDYPSPAVLAAYLRAEEFSDPAASIPLIGELDKLESLLSDLTPDDPAFEMVTSRLQRCLAKWGGNGASAKGQTVAQKIDSASDDEIFEFINKELGRS
jgi:short-subunit dehydrogenase/acyl carrier protein